MPSEVPATLRFTIPGEIGAIAVFHDLWSPFVDAHDIPPLVANYFCLALEELMTNSISYGLDDGSAHTITVLVTCRGNVLEAEIEDDGELFDPLQHVEARREPEGLEISLALKLMDSVEYEERNGRNLLRLLKRWQRDESV